MASITATVPALPPGRRWALYMAGVPAVAALVLFVVGIVVRSWLAGGHAQFHAVFASIFFVPALILARQRPGGGPATTPAVIGLTIAAFTQLVEGVGGLGYGPGNDDRVNALANVHDLGVMLAPVGLVGAALGVTLAVGARMRPRFGPWPALLLSAVVLAGLAFVIAKMIGI